ncbi:MAG: alpha/beta fold hydrolase [Steroidobacteraceae bacterium]
MNRGALALRLVPVALLAMGAGRAAPEVAGGHAAARFDIVSPCPFPTGAVAASRLICGYLDVPETRGAASGPRLRLPVVRIRAAVPGSHDDPVVFLHGGPGAAPLGSGRTIERFAAHPFAASRDIILFNQRGSAQSEPPLSCATLTGNATALVAADLDLATRDARVADAAERCLREITDAGRDLAAYGAVPAAADLRDLRVALGIGRWNVLAVSYGTLLALEAVRIDAPGIRSLILDSIVSPQSDLFMSEGPRNFSLGLDRLLDSCAADAACAADFPHLRTQLRAVIGNLATRPATVVVAGPGGEGTVALTVNWHDFLGAVHWMLYNAQTLRLVPLLIDRTQHGDLGVLTHVMDHIYPAPRNAAPGPSPAFFAFVCRDQYTAEAPRAPVPADPAYRGFSIVSFMAKACAGVVKDPPARALPIHSSVPALLLSGRFDPMTPEIYARQVAAGLPDSTLVVIGDSGHSTLSDFAACQTQLAVAFIDTLEASAPCLSVPARPHFLPGATPEIRSSAAPPR